MIIRKAEERDIPRIIELLGQVLQIHADIRPDIFIPDTTKYTVDELTELLKNEEKRYLLQQTKPIFVWDMHFVNCGSNLFQIIWCRLNPFLLMIFASIRRHVASISVKNCLNM